MLYSVKTLHYRLFDKNIDLTQYRIIKSQSAQHGNLKASFYVLGASHAVILQSGSTSLCELVTCTPGEAPDNSILDLPGCYHLPTCASGKSWNCVVNLETLFEIKEAPAFYAEYPPVNCFISDYPVPPVPIRLLPQTHIGWKFLTNGIEIETIHTYPEENSALRSFSTFKFLEDFHEAA